MNINQSSASPMTRLILAMTLIWLCMTEASAIPVFKPASCTFSSPISVEITADEGETIYFRTDGNVPAINENYKYESPVVISTTTTFKAISVDAAGKVSDVVTAVYTCTRHGIGEGYDPPSPGNPGGEAPAKTYHLTVLSNPVGAGSVYANSYDVKPGDKTRIYCYNGNGFVFQNWTIEGTIVSKATSFYYVMPEYDVTIVANYTYNPSSPGNPSPLDQPVKHPVSVRAIPSAAASMNPSGTFDMDENSKCSIYAYANNGWKLTGWTIDGQKQPQATSPLEITMKTKALDIAAYFSYEPSSPVNPSANYYNPSTGQVIIDDFTTGNLYRTLSNLVGNDFSNVSSLIVKGEIDDNDMGSLYRLSNTSTIDLSRTGGVDAISGYTFSSAGMSTLVLPSTISSIGNYAFRSCGSLNALVIHAMAPPECTAYTFAGFTNAANCTVYVPAGAIELYSNADYWKDFTILPIVNDAHVLQVNLPADASDGRYKHNSLELVNVNTGVRQRYVVSDRLLYTFSGLQTDEQYNIYMFSQNGLEIGRIENVVIPSQDIEVTFDTLKPLRGVSAKISDAAGRDVTSQVTVEWLRPLDDGSIVYVRKGVSLGEIPDGQKLICRVTLDSSLGIIYSNPGDEEFIVGEGHNVCKMTLEPLRSVQLSGVVVDSDGISMADASVSATQTLNGRYSKTYTAKTDRKGAWMLTVLDAPETRLTYAASECVNVNDTIGAFDAEVSKVDVGKAVLKSIVGARVTYGFTYRAAGSEAAEGYYSDYQNVAIDVYNVTQNRAHRDVSLQYPVLAVLDENIKPGDELKLTATSKTGAFNPIVQTVTVGDDTRADVTFDIVGKGGIAASFEKTDNPAVISMLYSASGELLKKQTYSEAKTTFAELADGDYTLVSMGQSDLMNSILRLSNFGEIGLTEGKDYVKNAVKVKSGVLAEVSNAEIPAFDESLFYYTNSSTGFSSNKSSITTGNYLTLRAAVDFKGVYKKDISNVALIVDLPENCDFVERSVVQGPNLLPYTLDSNRLTIQLGDNYQSQTRFCVIPTSGGNFNATASIVFDHAGKTITQPIGSAASDVKDIEITVSPTVTTPMFIVSGSAPGKSKVKIYEGMNTIGEGSANNLGGFVLECALDNPYNQSKYDIYAQIETLTGNILKTKTTSFIFDANAIVIENVIMSQGSYNVVFDFQNPNNASKYYSYSSGKFTFIINFNQPKAVKDVVLYVHTSSGEIMPYEAIYDEEKNIWFVTQSFSSSSVPVNVSLDFNTDVELEYDAMKMKKLYKDDLIALQDAMSDTKEEMELQESVNAAEMTRYNDQASSISSTSEYLLDDSNVDSDEYEEKLAELLQNIVPGFNPSMLDITLSDDYTPAMVDAILANGNKLLINEAYSSEDVNNIGASIDELLANIEKECNQESTLKVDLFEPLEFEYDGVKYIARQLNAEESNKLDLDIYEKTSLKLTDDGSINIYTEEDRWVVVNQKEGVCFIIESSDKSLQSKGLRKSKKWNIAFLENVKKEFNVANEKLISLISDLTEGFRKQIAELKVEIEVAENKRMDLTSQSAAKGRRVAEIEKQLKELKAAGKGGYRQFDLEAQRIALQKERKELIKQVDQISKDLGPLTKKVGSLKVKIVAANAFLAEVMDYWQIVDGMYCLIKYVCVGISDVQRWNGFINTIIPCDEDIQNATALKKRSEDNRDTALRGYCGAFTLAGLSEGIAIVMKATAKPVGWIMKFLCGALSGALLETSKDVYTQVNTDSRDNLNSRIIERNGLKCTKPKDPYSSPYYAPDDPTDPENDNKTKPKGGNHQSGNEDSGYGIDPAGYVYEAVPSNRVEGVQASIYYKEAKEDMYGDPYEEVVLWNAEEYAQKNPLFTDENGMYRWDVPQGLWQVKFEKDGYQTAYSEWLPVPPPQLDVNIGIVQRKQPEVTEARAYEEGVEVQFDKFMDLSTLTSANIYVTANGEKLSGEIRMVDSTLADEYASEDDADATRYASRIRFVPEQPLSVTTGEVRVTVNRNVKSYAGIPMTQTFTQVLDVEKEVQSIYAEDVKVLYGGEKEVTVYAIPYDAAVGRTLHVANSSDLIASVDAADIVLNDEGKAIVKVRGELPGRSQLIFTIDDVTTRGECAVDVVTEIVTAEPPKASRASGTAVYRGTKIVLTTDAKDGVIYFTTDGSCPCDANGTRRKYTVPIVINDDTKILAMTAVGNGDDDVSETVEFNYTLKHTAMDFMMPQGWSWISHNMESDVPTAQFAADGSVSRIVSQTQESIRDPQLGWIGTLDRLKASDGYKIETTASTQTLRLSDVAWNPSVPISLKAGWNWIGYPLGQTMAVDEALASTKAETLDVVVGQNGFAQYDGEQWIGTLETMSPGAGYMYQSASDKNLVYNTSVVSTASARASAGISRSNSYVTDPHKYPSVMPVIAMVDMGESHEVLSDDYQLLAFCGSECRGIGKTVDGLIMLNVYGNVDDKITFRVADGQSDTSYDTDASLSFSERVVGDVFNPWRIIVDAQSGIGDIASDDAVSVRLHIDGGNLFVTGIPLSDVNLLEIYDMDGQKILHADSLDSSGVKVSAFVPGVYAVVLNGYGRYSYHKIVIP